MQNSRHKARTSARHKGKRQTPGLHEHNVMMYPHQDTEEAGESAAQEAAEVAAGQS